MKRNKFFSRFIVVTLTTALLLVSGSRAIRVSALAELAPEVAPVFDTQIYQLQDYIDHGGMTDPQLDIFYTLAGFYAMGQAGSENYKLTNPYSTQSGVLNWLKDLGVETYNTLIGLVPDTVRLPNGSIQSTEVIKKAASLYVANLMGCALKAYQYNTYEDFEDDIENSDNFFIPWNRNTQYGLNTLYRLYGGIYEWQFKTEPFTSSVAWKTLPNVSTVLLNQLQQYYTTYNTTIRANSNYNTQYNLKLTSETILSYHYIFLNTSQNIISLVNNSGERFINTSVSQLAYIYTSGSTIRADFGTQNMGIGFATYNPNNYSKYVDIVRDFYNFNLSLSGNLTSDPKLFYEDFVDHVYVGDSWANRHEIFNVKDLNFEDTGNEYYVAPPEEHDYLLDIKGILQDILNNTNLYNVFIDNIYTPDGVLVHDIDLIRISTDIYDLLNQQNPPLPVNLNDISELTDNTYLDIVKERASAAGSTLANLVAFWHNCDFELVYVLFGAGITVLIGAFIGKWGHS